LKKDTGRTVELEETENELVAGFYVAQKRLKLMSV
jgi:hypothetical protein